MVTCQSLAKSGKKCKNRVARGKYCYLHKKSRFSSRRKTRKSKKRSFKLRKGSKKKWRSGSRKRKSKKRNWRSRKSKGKIKGKCQQYFDKKVRKNMREYKDGKWGSPKQAVAISYSQTRKRKGCSNFGKK
jgi:hypothetical protein